MNNYRLIAVDLDGTIVKSDQTISSYTQEVLLRVQRQGIKVVIASGRPTYGTSHVANTLHLDEFGGYVMSYNGGEICNWTTKEMLHAQTLDNDVLPYIYKFAREHNMPIMTYMGKEVVSEVADNDYIRYSSMRNRMPIRQVENFLETTQSAPIVKCIIVGASEQLQSVEAELQTALGQRASAYRSEPFFLEIVPHGIDKARGLEVLLQKTGIRQAELIAFGDGYNDIPMLQFAGMGVAMENAAKEIKKAANMVTCSNNDDGVALAIEKLFF